MAAQNKSNKCFGTWNSKSCFMFFILILIFIALSTYFSRGCSVTSFKEWYWPKHAHQITIEHSEQLIGHLVKIKRMVSQAHRAARSGTEKVMLADIFIEVGKALSFVQSNHQKLSHLVKKKNSTVPSVTKSGTILKSPVEEKFLGKRKGYPWFFEGYYWIKTSGSPPWNKIMSAIVTTPSCSAAVKVKAGFTKLKNRFSSYKSNALQQIPHKIYSSEKCDVSTHKSKDSMTGKDWKTELNSLSSEFVLIARSLELLNWFSLPERLIDMIYKAPAQVVSGGTRNNAGHWNAGCFQANMRNYTLKLVEGYDASFKSCMYCDYVTGPFLARRSLLISMLRDNLRGEALWLDFFMQLKYSSSKVNLVMSCPDAMYHVTNNEPSILLPRSQLISVAPVWKLNRILLPGQVHKFSCKEASVGCGVSGGKLQPICCIEELGHHLKDLVFQVRKSKSRGECDAGTVIGLLKTGVLPWELDHDFDVLAPQWPAFEKRMPDFRKSGYTMVRSNEYGKDAVACAKKANASHGYANCGYYAMRRNGFRTEVYAASHLSDYISTEVGLPRDLNQTVIYYDGSWIPVPMNPAMYARNLFTDNIFMHVQHWITLGYNSGWSKYSSVETGHFTKCSTPHFHGCLNGNYLGDGNLQFIEYV